MAEEKINTHCWSEIVKRKRPLGRPRCRWEGNIKMDHKNEVGTGSHNGMGVIVICDTM
jgi:hypothetical protein